MPKLVLTWFGEQAVALTGDGQTHVSAHRRTEHGSLAEMGETSDGWRAAGGRRAGGAVDGRWMQLKGTWPLIGPFLPLFRQVEMFQNESYEKLPIPVF